MNAVILGDLNMQPTNQIFWKNIALLSYSNLIQVKVFKIQGDEDW